MGKTNFVPIFVILIFLSANQSVSANLKENSDVVNGIIPRKIDVDRQGSIGSTLFGGPLALAAFLFSLPLLPALLIAPLAVAGIRPAIGAVGNFMSSFGSSGASSGLGSFSNFLTPPNTGTADEPLNAASSTISTTGSSQGSGPMASLTAALRSISELLFSRRLGYQNSHRPSQSQNKPQNPQNSHFPGHGLLLGFWFVFLRPADGSLFVVGRETEVGEEKGKEKRQNRQQKKR
jgi:hypothetical protein